MKARILLIILAFVIMGFDFRDGPPKVGLGLSTKVTVTAGGGTAPPGTGDAILWDASGDKILWDASGDEVQWE